MTHKILVLGDDADAADILRSALSGQDAVVEGMAGSLVSVNGKAVDLLSHHDMLLFDADADDEAMLAAIAELASKRRPGKALIALTDGDLPLAKARRLQQIGVDDVLPRGMERDDLAAAMRARLQLQTSESRRSAEGAVIAFAQARGGIGATTLAVNTAELLHKAPGRFRRGQARRVVIVDLDLQFGNANVFLDLEDNGGMMNLFGTGEAPDTSFIRSLVQSHKSGVDIISAPVSMAPLQALRASTVAAMIDVLRSQYDYVIVDLPRAMIDWVEPVLERTSRLVIVTDTTVPCVRQAQRMIEVYRETNIGLVVDFVVNREQRPFMGAEHIRQAESALGTKLVHWVPDNGKIARKSVDLGVPLVHSYPRSDAAKAIARFAAGLAKAHPPALTKTA